MTGKACWPVHLEMRVLVPAGSVTLPFSIFGILPVLDLFD